MRRTSACSQGDAWGTVAQTQSAYPAGYPPGQTQGYPSAASMYYSGQGEVRAGNYVQTNGGPYAPAYAPYAQQQSWSDDSRGYDSCRCSRHFDDAYEQFSDDDYESGRDYGRRARRERRRERRHVADVLSAARTATNAATAALVTSATAQPTSTIQSFSMSDMQAYAGNMSDLKTRMELMQMELQALKTQSPASTSANALAPWSSQGQEFFISQEIARQKRMTDLEQQVALAQKAADSSRVMAWIAVLAGLAALAAMTYIIYRLSKAERVAFRIADAISGVAEKTLAVVAARAPGWLEQGRDTVQRFLDSRERRHRSSRRRYD